MNFFGHAAITSARSRAADGAGASGNVSAEELAELCLGSMLPDFVGMLRLGAPAHTSAAVERGIHLHHLTDSAFHDLPHFLRLSRGALAWLRAAGVASGTARAVAHIGVELLLDEWLARDSAARSAYRAALRCPLRAALAFPSPDDFIRLEALRLALLERTSEQPPAPADVARRIRRSLSSRPRLATDDAGELLITSWVQQARPEVATSALELVAALHGELDQRAR